MAHRSQTLWLSVVLGAVAFHSSDIMDRAFRRSPAFLSSPVMTRTFKRAAAFKSSSVMSTALQRAPAFGPPQAARRVRSR